MINLPTYISLVFIATAAFTFFFLYRAMQPSRIAVVALLSWLGLQAFLALTGFYLVTDTMPPRFILAIAPALVAVLFIFIVPGGRRRQNNWPLRWLTWLHVVRIPVELVLYWLYQHGQVPLLMTFEGSNPDILSGLSAPLIAWLAFRQGRVNRWLLTGWNLVCLGLLVNIVVRAVLAAPTPIQQWGFEQPNTGVLYFPFVWLPAFIVPAVLLSHLAALRLLLTGTYLKTYDRV